MNLDFRVDASLAVPLHRQVYDALRTAILTGELGAGERLPASRVLAEGLGVSRHTVSDSYEQLRAEGYIQGRRGSGTYVASNLPAEAGGTHQQIAQPAPTHRSVRLSSWGQRVTSGKYRGLYRSPDPVQFAYDLRAHAVARDSFPWDAWEDAMDRAMARNREQLLSYPPSAGHPDLRCAIATHIGQYRGVRCDPDQVVVVNGTQQGLNLLAHLLLDPGDPVAVEDPGYPTARLALEARGLAVTRVPVDAYGLEVSRLHVGMPYRLVHVTPSHQDPTGATLSLPRRLELLEIASQWDALVFEDDYDSEFRYEGRPVESLQGLDRTGQVVYAGTFSKSVLAGLRIGYLVLPRHLLSSFIAAKTLWDSGAPMLEQAVLFEFMQSGEYERHIRKMRRLYRIRRDVLVEALENTFGTRVTVGTHHGGLNVLVTLDLPFTEEEITERAAAASIGLRPASPYFAEARAIPTFLIGFAGLTEPVIPDAVQLLASALDYAPAATGSGVSIGV